MNFQRNSRLSREEFLSELRRECAVRFERDTTETLISEVDAHLLESIQSRLELGEAPAIAELNAVAAFARPHEFVRSMKQVYRTVPHHDWPLFVFGLFALAVLGLTLDFGMTFVVPLIWPMMFVGIYLLRRSWKLGSPRWGTFGTLVLASVIVFGVIQPLSVLNLWHYGGYQRIPVLGSQQFVDMTRNQPMMLNLLDSSSKTGYRGQVWTGDSRDETQPLVRALSASLWERYTSNAQRIPTMLLYSWTFTFALLFVPLVVQSRWRRLWETRRGARR